MSQYGLLSGMAGCILVENQGADTAGLRSLVIRWRCKDTILTYAAGIQGPRLCHKSPVFYDEAFDGSSS